MGGIFTTGEQGPEPASTTGPAKVEPKKTTTSATTHARASESGDAGVQNLLALRQIHQMNGDVKAIAAIDAQLAEAGFTAK